MLLSLQWPASNQRAQGDTQHRLGIVSRPQQPSGAFNPSTRQASHWIHDHVAWMPCPNEPGLAAEPSVESLTNVHHFPSHQRLFPIEGYPYLGYLVDMSVLLYPGQVVLGFELL